MAADRVRPIEQREKRVRVEPLVVDGAECTGSLQELGGRAALSRLDRLGETEARGRGEKIAGRLVGERAAHDPMSLCPEWQGVHRMLCASGRLRVVKRPLMQVEDGRPGLGPDSNSELDGLGQDDLFLGVQERDTSDLTEVQARRILDIDASVVRIGVGFGIGIGFRHGRDLVDDGLELDLLKLVGDDDRAWRLDVLVVGVAGKLGQSCSVCEDGAWRCAFARY